MDRSNLRNQEAPRDPRLNPPGLPKFQFPPSQQWELPRYPDPAHTHAPGVDRTNLGFRPCALPRHPGLVTHGKPGMRRPLPGILPWDLHAERRFYLPPPPGLYGANPKDWSGFGEATVTPRDQPAMDGSYAFASRPWEPRLEPRLNPRSMESYEAWLERTESAKPVPRASVPKGSPEWATRSSAPTHTGLITKTRLPGEVLLMIFHQLQGSSSLSNLRLVSRQFDDLVVPIFYRHIVLNNRIVDSYSTTPLPKTFGVKNPAFDRPPDRRAFYMAPELFDLPHDLPQPELQFFHQMRLHTKHISINRKLEKNQTRRLCESLKDLRYITWSIWDQDLHNFPWDALSYLDIVLRRRRPNVKYIIEGFDANHYIGLPSGLVSCKVVEWFSPSMHYYNKSLMNELLAGRPDLRKLHLVSGKNTATIQDSEIVHHEPYIPVHEQYEYGAWPTYWDMALRGRLPPLQELVLEGYDWKHSPTVAVNFWNWTQLTHLELRRVPIVPFLRTVPPENFQQLRTFVTDGFCKVLERAEATRLISNLVRRIHAIERLGIPYLPSLNFIPLLCQHGSSIRTLEIQGCVVEGRRESFQISASDLDTIGRACPHLMELDLASRTLGQAAEMINPLASFRNLRRLKIHIKTTYWARYEPEDTLKKEHRSLSHHWMLRLLRDKIGAKFENLVLNTELWKSPLPDVFISRESFQYAHSIYTYTSDSGAISETTSSPKN